MTDDPDIYDYAVRGSGKYSYLYVHCKMCNKQAHPGEEHRESEKHLKKWDQYKTFGASQMVLYPLDALTPARLAPVPEDGDLQEPSVSFDFPTAATVGASLDLSSSGRPAQSTSMLQSYAELSSISHLDDVASASGAGINARAAAPTVSQSDKPGMKKTIDVTSSQHMDNIIEGHSLDIPDKVPGKFFKEPDVFKVLFVDNHGAKYFEVKCHLCHNKNCWPDEEHLSSAIHRKRYAHWSFRKEAQDRPLRNIDIARQGTSLICKPAPPPPFDEVPDTVASNLTAEQRSALRRRLRSEEATALESAGSVDGTTAREHQATESASSGGRATQQSRTEQLEWDPDFATMDPVPKGLDEYSRAKTELDKLNMFSPYNFRKRTYNLKASAVLGRDLDEEEYQLKDEECQLDRLGRHAPQILCFAGLPMTARGRHSSGASSYASAKTYRITPSNLSRLGAARESQVAASRSSQGNHAGPWEKQVLEDRMSIYSRVSTSNNSILNKAGNVSKTWQDHQAIAHLAERQPRTYSHPKYAFWCYSAGIPGRQLPYEWVILKPSKDSKKCEDGLTLHCLLCNMTPRDAVSEGVNHTCDGPKNHRQLLDNYRAHREEVRQRRWEIIRKYSPKYWQPGWSTDKIAEQRKRGLFSVYCTLWPEEQFAVRMALMHGWERLKQYIEAGTYTREEVQLQQFEYTEVDLAVMYNIYKEIAFGRKADEWKKYVPESDKMTDVDSEEEADAAAIEFMLAEKQRDESAGGNVAGSEAGGGHVPFQSAATTDNCGKKETLLPNDADATSDEPPRVELRPKEKKAKSKKEDDSQDNRDTTAETRHADGKKDKKSKKERRTSAPENKSGNVESAAGRRQEKKSGKKKRSCSSESLRTSSSRAGA
ncbi:unnamed protein product [Amoebophrya sp. A120]|nr:unnamed protein product [Amoebophrya sp. A120]|eukprot:GSA120T00002525001.1